MPLWLIIPWPHPKRQIDHAVEINCHIDMEQYQTQLMKDFEARTLATQLQQEWKLNLVLLVEELEDKEAIRKTLSCVLERETCVMQGELTNDHYIYMLVKANFEQVVKRPQPQINLESMIVMAYSHRPYTS